MLKVNCRAISGLQDKTKATVLIQEASIIDKASGDLKAKIFTGLFIKGIGGFGHKGTFKSEVSMLPASPPSSTTEIKTEPNQAFLYRLSGDRNPLHVDPAMAAMGGFKTPILHGLCTYGITARAVYEQYHTADP
jgi:hypothetical protein